MPVNWNLAQQPNALAMMMQGFEQGRELRKKEASQNALSTILKGGQGTTPGQTPGIGDGIPGNTRMDGGVNDGADWSALQGDDLRTAITLRGQQQTQQAKQQEAQQQQLIQMGRLLNSATDETTYQQSLAAAKQIGIDVSRAPQSFDPNWIAQQKTVLSAFEKDGGAQISGLARELQDAGYKPGTPEFQQAMTTALQGKYAPQYTDQQGNLRQARLPDLPQPGGAQPQAKPQIIPQRPQGMSDADLFAQAREAVANGADRNTVFEQLQAWGVKP